MGASASVQSTIDAELQKPLDASDISNLEEAQNEIKRLRELIKVSAESGTSSTQNEERKKVVIFAPPAGGKGTQCVKIKETFGVVHLSTGDMLRANVKVGIFYLIDLCG